MALATLVAIVLCMKGARRVRTERSTPSVAETAGSATPQEALGVEVRDGEDWRLEVEIVDENDAPISGNVYVIDATGELMCAFHVQPGAPLVHGLRGTVAVIAHGDSRAFAPRMLAGISPPTPGMLSLRIRLEAGREISGRLVDDTGNPINNRDATGVRVHAEPANPSWLLPQKAPSWRQVTDEDGYWIAFSASCNREGGFRIGGLPPGFYRLTADTTAAPSLLPPEEPALVESGASDAVLVLPRAAEIRIRFLDSETGNPLDGVAVSWTATTEGGEVLSSGGGSYGRRGLVLQQRLGTSFVFDVKAESYEPPQPFRVSVSHDGSAQEFEARFRREAGGVADLELVVRDDAGQPAFPLIVGRGPSSQECLARDGRYVLKVPAGPQRFRLGSPDDQILGFKREWIPSTYDPNDFPPAHAYLPLVVEIELPRGGRVTKEVTIQRAALIWVRQEPTSAFSAVCLLRGDTEVERALMDLYEDKGLVAAIEPGTYTVEGKAGGKIVKVEVEAKAAEVAAVWLRAENDK